MRFWIVQHPGETNIMAIDDASYQNISLPGWNSTIDFINWDGKKGDIRYWTQPGITVNFVDPTPYVPYINNWLTVASTMNPPINLDQAKKVKSDLVDTLFDIKRQLPIVYDGYTWDATDESMQSMMALVGGGQSLAEVNVTLHALWADINSAWSIHIADLNTQLNSIAVSHNQSIVGYTAGFSISGGGGDIPDTGGSIPPPVLTKPSPGEHYVNGTVCGDISISEHLVTATTLTYQWIPIGWVDPITVTMATMNGIFYSVAARRGTFQSVRTSKKYAIAACTTIQQVIAFDVLAGW
jgi:hypothetical protein